MDVLRRIEKMSTSLLPSIVVTDMLLGLLNAKSEGRLEGDVEGGSSSG